MRVVRPENHIARTTTIREEKRQLALAYEIREGKFSELRLYNLRKFRKYANQMGLSM